MKFLFVCWVTCLLLRDAVLLLFVCLFSFDSFVDFFAASACVFLLFCLLFGVGVFLGGGVFLYET